MSNIDVILITLNDEVNMDEVCTSLLKSDFNKLIIVDGGSTDDTVRIARKYTSHVLVTSKGMAHQTRTGLRHISTDYVFLAEADHIYPCNFIENLRAELEHTSWDGIQGTLDVREPKTIWEYFHKCFYYVHQHDKGERSIIACPQLWKSKSILLLFDDLVGGESYCFDTQRAESAAKLGLVCGLGYSVAYEDQHISLRRFVKRHLNYGAGDYDFYKSNAKLWTLRRRIKSMTHVGRRYCVEYPLKALFYGCNPIAIPYFYLISVVRYSGFIARACRMM